MKKILFPALLMSIFMISCSNSTSNEETSPEALAEASHQELTDAIADRDSLIGLVNDINADMLKIKELEGILTAPDMSQGEIPSQHNDACENLMAIRASLSERRQRLQMLEKNLKNSKLANKKLQETINTLTAQIEAQQAEIDNLTAQLETANQRIGQLNVRVDSLNTTVSTVSAERDAAQGEAQQLTTELNTVYYVCASKKELKAHNIVEGGGFLQKTKTMQGNFDSSFFKTADKRYLKTIELYSKKAKVLTQQPADSYQIDTDASGMKVLTILNPAKFWATAPYLVVQID